MKKILSVLSLGIILLLSFGSTLVKANERAEIRPQLINHIFQSEAPEWQNLGIYGGNINDVVVDPETDWVYLVLNGYPGVYRSQDSGQSWSPIGEGYAAAQRILIDKNGSLYANFDILRKSMDDGVTWQPIVDISVIESVHIIPAFDIHPDNPDLIVMGTGSGSTKDAEVYFTTDGGMNWNQSSINIPISSRIFDIAFDPTDPNGQRIYAVNKDLESSNTASNVYRSDDGGATFVVEIAVPPGEQLSEIGVNRNGTVYAGTTSGLYRKQTSGVWEPRNFNGMSINMIEFDVSDPEIVYIDNYVSYNDGDSWSPKSVHGYFAQSPNEPDLMFTLSKLGLKRSMDGGETWVESVEGIEAVLIWSMAADVQNQDVLFVATQQGLGRSLDGGDTWDFPMESIMPDRMSLITSPVDSGVVFIGGNAGDVDISNDHGENWTHQLIDPENETAVWDIAIDPRDNNFVYAATASYFSEIGNSIGGLFVSNDGGDTWGSAIPDLPANAVEAASDPDKTVVYAGFGDYWYGNETGGVYRWTASEGWDQVGLADKVVNAIAVNPNNPDLVFAGTVKEIFAENSVTPVYRSVNGGASWEPLKIDNCGNIEAIVINPNFPNEIYVSACNQLHKSVNNGDSWFLYYMGRDGDQFQALYMPMIENPGAQSNLARVQPNGTPIYLGTSKGLYLNFSSHNFVYLPIINR